MKPIHQIIEENNWNVIEVRPVMFTRNSIQGYHVVFTNGRVVSVQAGPHNYCSNRSYSIDEYENPHSNYWETDVMECEIATWTDDQGGAPGVGEMQKAFGNHDTVKGWVTEENLIEFVNRVQYVDRHFGIEGVCRDHSISSFMGYKDDSKGYDYDDEESAE